MANLSTKINTIAPIDSYIASQWEMFTPNLYESGIERTVTLDPAIAYKYRFDFYGLLLNEYSIPYETMIPHLIINGYTSSTDFDGTRLEVHLLNKAMLASYLQSINKTRIKN